MKSALISVSDKSGLDQLAPALLAAGYQLLASGGSARHLRELGLPVRSSSELTGFEDLLGGRVKTLHPHIHAGILARPAELPELERDGLPAIDLVIVNLYPFERYSQGQHSEAESIENIDIGGVALLRAAAKNFERVASVCDPADYPRLAAALAAGDYGIELRRSLAAKAFAHCSNYDRLIAAFLESNDKAAGHPDWQLQQQLRYGENPGQDAAWYHWRGAPTGLAALRQVQGKQLSYNNLLDAELAASCAHDFPQCTWAIIKHASPCAVASAAQPALALERAWGADSESAFGGVLACNRELDLASARLLADKFIELIIAPSASAEALDQLATKKQTRILLGAWQADPRLRYRSLSGGVLAQQANSGELLGDDWRVVSQRQPSAELQAELLFALRVAKFVRSNAIVVACSQSTQGIGGGQTSRVRSLKLAWQQALANGVDPSQAVIASDGFFPFPDSVTYACEQGVRAFIAPGGSIRDQEVIAAADSHKAVLIFSGRRHFLH